MNEAALQWIGRFLTHLSSERRLSKHTDENYRRDLNLFSQYCEKTGLSSWSNIDSQHIRTFAATEFRRGQSPRTIQRRLSALRSFCNFLIREGELKATGPGSITEGIGIGRVTANLEGAPLDDALHVTDVECVRTVYQLLREEGLFLGSTSGVNVAAAVQLAQRLGPGHTIVTLLCDTGAKYQSRLFNRKWLGEKGLLDATGLDQPLAADLVPPVPFTEIAPREIARADAHRLSA